MSLSILVPAAPASAARQSAEPLVPTAAVSKAAEPRAETYRTFGLGEQLQPGPIEKTCGGTGQPACPAAQLLSGGGGGFIPVAAERVLDTPGDPAVRPLGRGEARVVPIAGAGSVPVDDVAAVVLSVTATRATLPSEITIWPTGSARPAAATMSVLPAIAQRSLAIVPLGTDGTVTVHNRFGQAELVIDVLGWFAGPDAYRAVAPTTLLDTLDPPRGRPGPLKPGQTIELDVLGRGEVPDSHVAAVVLHVSSVLSTRESKVTIYPKGTPRPAEPSFVAWPLVPRDDLVVVQPGADGSVFVHNELGRTNLQIDVVGWIPDDSTYRPVTPALLHASEPRTPLAADATVEIQVAGVGGVPAIDGDATTEQAHSVLVRITATPTRPRATTLTVFPAGDTRPTTTSLAAPGVRAPSAGLTVVPLSVDGRISLYNADTAVDVRVDVVGWFATPVAAVQVLVPETTKAPEPEEIASIEVTHDETGAVTAATVALDPAAPDVALGDHLVLGITEQTPEGLLGTVTEVTSAPDGTQVVTTEPALLEEVFPEGDIVGSLAEVASAQAARQGVVTLAKVMPDPGQKGKKLDDPFADDDVDLEGLDEGGNACSLEGVEVDFGPYVDMQFDVHWRWFKAPRVTALVTLGAQAKMALHDVAVTCGWESPRLRFTTMVLVGPLPVVLTFEVGASLDISAGLAGIDIEASANAWVTVGVKDNAGYADAGWDVTTPSMNDLLLQARHLRAFALADVWLDFSVKLYGVIGPQIAVGPFLETAASTEVRNPEVPWWTLDIGLAAKVNLQLNLWFKSWSWSLWDGEIPLATFLYDAGVIENCTGASAAFMTEEPCRAPAPPDGKRVNGVKRAVAPRIRLASSSNGFNPLAVTGPSNIMTAIGTPTSVDFGVSGFLSTGALVRVAPSTPGVPGLAFADAQADGWSASGLLTGAVPTAGTYTLELEARYKVEDSPPDLTLRAHRTVYVTVQPEDVFGGAASVTAGARHTCALLKDRSVACWGANASGQLGDGSTTSRATPTAVPGITNATMVAAGITHTCALLEDGTIRCWGDNSSGQLGDGSTTSRSTPVAVSGISSATSISAGWMHTCALLADHTVQCWGSNREGLLGDGTTTSRSTPVAVSGITNATAIAAGWIHTCGLLADHTIRCWGDNSSGQLGDGSTSAYQTTPVVVRNLSTVTAIAAGYADTCALLADHTIRCWGDNTNGKLGDGSTTERRAPVTVVGISSGSAISASDFHTCALLTDHTIHCWGSNDDGQLGDGSTTERHTQVPVSGISSATVVAAGYAHTCAVFASGAVACWGDNAYGQLGDATTTDRHSPIPVIGLVTPPGAPTGVTGTGGNASAIVSWTAPFDTGGSIVSSYTVTASTGGATCTWSDGPLSCTVTGLTNGTDYTFTVTATNAAGTSGASATSNHVIPAPTVPAAPSSVRAARGNTQATISWAAPDDGGSPITKYTVTASRGGRTCTWTSGPLTCTITGLTNGLSYTFTVAATNGRGTGPASLPSDPVTPATTAGPPTGVVAAAVDGSALVTWLAPASDGDSVITGYTVTSSPGGLTCASEAGERECLVEGLVNEQAYTFAVTATNDVGTGAPSTASASVTPRVVAATSVSAGLGGHTCAVLVSGAVICWGQNESGQLGDRTTDATTTPVVVRGVGSAIDVASGSGYSCAVLQSGSVVCWGDNTYGQLGNGTMTPNMAPVKVALITNATAVVAGDGHTCALLADHRIRCWGRGGSGQVGDGYWADRATPTEVSYITNATALSAGLRHTCALLADGTLRCWGLNTFGGLGDETTENRGRMVVVKNVTQATGVAAGGHHTCADVQHADVRCWGDNLFGQLGNGTSGDRSLVPVDVPGEKDAKAVTAGFGHTCALRELGAVTCWGSGLQGQLGNGAWSDSTLPVPVSDLTDATAVSAGLSHTCAIRGAGQVVCWGVNTHGELGDGSLTSSNVPVTVSVFTLVPDAPTGVTASAGNGRASISWSAPAFDGGSPITGYTVTASPGGKHCATAGETHCVVTGLTNGTTYTFTVVATNAKGTGPASAPSEAATPLAGQSRLVAWGDNTAGQTIAPAGVIDATAIAAGAEHSLALRENGTVVAWGSNLFGETTVPDGLSNVTAIAAGGHHSLAQLEDRTVVAWGSNAMGQAAVPADLSDVIGIAAGTNHSLALLADRTVVGWGDNTDGALTPPADLGPVKALAAGDGFSLALTTDGNVVAWGRNDAGQTSVPEELAGTVIAIAAGASHAVALTEDGQVVAWGDDSFGQTDVSGEAWGVIAIAAGAKHTLALRRDGQVVAWGDPTSGATDVAPNAAGATAIAAGGAHSVALATREQSIYFDPPCPALVGRPGAVIAGASSHLPVAFTASPASVCTIGGTTGDLTLLAAGTCTVTVAQEGNADWNPAQPVTRDVTVAMPDSPIVAWGDVSGCQCSVPAGIVAPKAIAAGGMHTLALAADGTVSGWGDNQLGQATPPTGLSGVKAIDAGFMHSLALREDGTVVAWGADDAGQGSIPADLVDDLVDTKAISAGGNHNLAIRPDHTVVAWGANDQGQTTVPGGLTGVTAISAGMNHSLALLTDGTVVAWGGNESGQSTVPAGLQDVIAIAAGGRHSLALTSDGTVVAWGDDSAGQTTVPSDLGPVAAIAAGGNHSLALLTDGTVATWGGTYPRLRRIPDGLNHVIAIGAGEFHSVALFSE